jgi:hypothetical protein
MGQLAGGLLASIVEGQPAQDPRGSTSQREGSTSPEFSMGQLAHRVMGQLADTKVY